MYGGFDSSFRLLAAEVGSHELVHAARGRDDTRDGRTRSAEVDRLGDEEEVAAVHCAEHEGCEEEVRDEAHEEALDSDLVGRVEHAVRGQLVKRRLIALEGRHWARGGRGKARRAQSRRGGKRKVNAVTRSALHSVNFCVGGHRFHFCNRLGQKVECKVSVRESVWRLTGGRRGIRSMAHAFYLHRTYRNTGSRPLALQLFVLHPLFVFGTYNLHSNATSAHRNRPQ